MREIAKTARVKNQIGHLQAIAKQEGSSQGSSSSSRYCIALLIGDFSSLAYCIGTLYDTRFAGSSMRRTVSAVSARAVFYNAIGEDAIA